MSLLYYQRGFPTFSPADLTAGGVAGDAAVWCLSVDTVYATASRALQGSEEDSQEATFWSMLSGGDPNAGLLLRERVRAFSDVTSSTEFTDVFESKIFFQ